VVYSVSEVMPSGNEDRGRGLTRIAGGSQNCRCSGRSNIGRVGLFIGEGGSDAGRCFYTCVDRANREQYVLIPGVRRGRLSRPSSLFA
jgi:hypothetical protein